MENIDKYTDKAIELLMEYGPKLLLAILVLIVGMWIIKNVLKRMNKTFEKRNVDPSLRPFLVSVLSVLLKALLLISVMTMIGIAMTSFVAILAAAGLAIGMALSGTLQNFAGGVMILLFKPFKVGDLIESQGHAGVVKEIQIFHTILETPDGRTIILPNAPVSNDALVNKSTRPERRVDISVGIGYADDIDKARKVIQAVVDKDERILKEPATDILVSELGDSSVNFAIRMWVKSADYWGVHFSAREAVKKAFDKEGVSIPFPQRDVHLIK